MTKYALLKLLERAQPILANAAKDPALDGAQEAHRLLVAEEVRKAAVSLETDLLTKGFAEYSAGARRRTVSRGRI